MVLCLRRKGAYRTMKTSRKIAGMFLLCLFLTGCSYRQAGPLVQAETIEWEAEEISPDPVVMPVPSPTPTPAPTDEPEDRGFDFTICFAGISIWMKTGTPPSF